MHRPTSDKPFLLSNGSGGGGGREDYDLLLPQPQPFDQNLFIQEDEMASWLHYHDHSSNLATQPEASIALIPPTPLTSLYAPSAERLAATATATAARWPANFTNFSRIRGNTFVEAGRLRQVDSSAASSSSATESCLPPATHAAESRGMVTGRVLPTIVVPGLTPKEKAVTTENTGTSSSPDFKAETELIQTQPQTETIITDNRKRKEREETLNEIELSQSSELKEARGSTTTSKKKSRASQTHNLSEKRRRERINEKMKTLQELVPRCNKSNKASVLDDAINYLKSLQMHLQVLSTGGVPIMYPPNMQQFMPHMAMGMNQPPIIPFTGMTSHMASLGPVPRYPIPNTKPSDASEVHLPRPEVNQVSNQSQFSAYMNPYSQFVGLHQMQQPPPPQNQTTSQPSCSQA